MTPAECRTARAALGWTKVRLAKQAGVSLWSVKHFELYGTGAADGVVALMREALVAGGVRIGRHSGFSTVTFREGKNPAP